jgi:hypothetical protein
MGYTLGAAAKAVGMSKTSILGSVRASRISAARDEFAQWCIEPVELHRVYPAVTDVTEANGTGKRAVTGGGTALVEANVRAFLLEQALPDLKAALNEMRGQRDDLCEQRDRWQAKAERLVALAITDQRKEAAPAQPQSWWRRLRA